jgi:hypothetical protein
MQLSRFLLLGYEIDDSRDEEEEDMSDDEFVFRHMNDEASLFSIIGHNAKHNMIYFNDGDAEWIDKIGSSDD